MTYCYDNQVADCRDVPLQPANFVYLRTAPSFDAPLITNPYITADPTRANNWANKAMTGQQFYRVERSGQWDAIYFSGQKAWFHNPQRKNTVRGSGILAPSCLACSENIIEHIQPQANCAESSGCTCV